MITIADTSDPMAEEELIIIGGGLAGCEAAWQAARRGVKVLLFEMKPERFSPAHRSADLAELVCSNSLRAESLENAVGLLKEEMRRMDALFMHAADATRVPAGGALAVDRKQFSRFITEAIAHQGSIRVIRREITTLDFPRPLVIASGPLTSAPLAERISKLIGREYLYFYDAIAPVVESESVDRTVAFQASRYGRGGDDYLNCPLSREEYYRLVEEIIGARKVPLREFEHAIFFEGCLPIEEMASRGKDTLAFGPLKPVGLIDPRTGRQPFAVVQLRPENREATLYNLVGFQTRMAWGEQERVLRLIPGLAQARFVRLGSCHRNIFLNAPELLLPSLQLRKDPGVFFAGQMTGVEGYVESAAMGMLAGINAARMVQRTSVLPPPPTTAVGALVAHITGADKNAFQPMNVNWGLFPPLERAVKKKDRRAELARRALEDLLAWRDALS